MEHAGQQPNLAKMSESDFHPKSPGRISVDSTFTTATASK
jgi:hypothetical protein